MVQRTLALALAVIVTIGLAPAASAQETAPPSPDPDWPGVACAPTLPGPRAVVQLAYIVLLRRCPDAAGAASWEMSLRDGMAVETFARRIAFTPESRGIVVGDAYEQVLDRPAAPSERAFWSTWLRPDPNRARRHDQLLAELAASTEMYAQAGNDDAAWVALVYERILGRPASTADRDYWVDRLADLPSDRRALTRMLLRLNEPLGATVDEVWLQVLGVTPNGPDRQGYIARLRADGDRLGLAARLVASDGFHAKAQDRALVVPGRYVALGDSFVVGEGFIPYDEEAEELRRDRAVGEPLTWRCEHADPAYPEVARTSSEQVPSDLDVAACSGAGLLDLYPYVDEDEDFAMNGQIDAIAEGEAPSLVTLTIGGSDIGFMSLVSSCLQIQIGGTGQHSPYYDRQDCDALYEDWVPASLAQLRDGYGDMTEPDGDGYQCPEPCSLTSAVTDVVEAAPEARVVVVGYPPVMPAVDTGCRGPVRIDGKVAEGVEWYVAPGDVRRGREVIADLNALLRDAAEAAGATFVDPLQRFSGHEACSADPWINGVELDEDAFPRYSTFHPNRRGGVGLAATLTEALEG
jgi:hypothetical protein